MKKVAFALAGMSILALAIYSYFKNQAKKLLDYDWKISAIRVKKFSLNELFLDVTFLFISKADLEAKIERLYLDLYLEDKNVGYIQEDKPFIIPARGSASVPLSISINPQYVFKNIIDISLGVGAKKDVKFKLRGFAKIKSGFITTTIPIEYETTIKEYLGVLPPKK